jgi:sugar lactone lactonase YvrE
MSSEPAGSNSNMTFTLDPYDNLTGSTTYKTRVTTGVKDAAGNSMSSQYDNSTGFKTTLLAPDNLTATVGYKQVALAWDNVSSVASSYTVYWDNATGVSKSSTAITNVSDDNYTHTGLTGGATYYYKVAAVNSSGTGALSSEVNATAGAIQYLIGGSMQETELDLSTAVTTLAGQSDSGTTDGTGTSARFNAPGGITTDGTNLYVADFSNNRIRKIVISTGVVTTLAGSSEGYTDATGTSARFYNPYGITTDGTNLYVTDLWNHRIRKIVISTGVVTTLAGSSEGYTDATGTSARFNMPFGITTDGTNLYVADFLNSRIRKIVISTGVVTTLAGSSSGYTDATGTSARFKSLVGITTDGTNLYVSDQSNHRIRKIVIDNGTVTTLAGQSDNGTTDATGTSARFYNPQGITTDGTNLYVTDLWNHRIRKIVISTGVVTTLAGSSQGYTDATGTSARFNYPNDITTDGTNLYVADTSNNRIRKIE